MKYTGVTADSREVKKGFVYVAVCGSARDGHDFIGQAVEAGAAAVVCRRMPEIIHDGVEYIQTDDTRRELSRLLSEFHGHPETKLDFFGVTGTNGKTTTVYLLSDFLKRSGRQCGMLSTVEFRTPQTVQPATHTTPDAVKFYSLLAQCAAENADSIAMELSSHALDQHRVDGVLFKTAVFTNLTGDHLDYHKTSEAYFAAKKRLFTRMLACDGTAVVNIDDVYGRILADELKNSVNTVTFGTSPDADCVISGIRLAAEGSFFLLDYCGVRYEIATTMSGEHNLHNLTGAMLGAEAMGCNWEKLCAFAGNPAAVPGRLERIVSPDGVIFMVDYAHTDDALRQVLTDLRKITAGRIICVFGCGGDRDRTKRPRMGQAASELADMAVVTSDNPRSEEPMAIIKDILSGIGSDGNAAIEPDRGKAIRMAYSLASPGDIVLVAGKGHEHYQEIKGRRLDFSDREIIRSLWQNAQLNPLNTEQ